MAQGKLKWYGDRVIRKIEKAERIGINATMGEGVAIAKAEHPFTYRDGVAERSIGIVAQAANYSGEVFGLWGSRGCKYFKALENPKPSSGNVIKGKPVWSGGQSGPTLKPAADKAYPNLFKHIKSAFRRLGKVA